MSSTITTRAPTHPTVEWSWPSVHLSVLSEHCNTHDMHDGKSGDFKWLSLSFHEFQQDHKYYVDIIWDGLPSPSMSILPSIPLGHAKDPQENRKETFCRWQEGKRWKLLACFLQLVVTMIFSITIISTASTMLPWIWAEKMLILHQRNSYVLATMKIKSTLVET